MQSMSTLSLCGKGSSLILPHVFLPRLTMLSISTFEDIDAEVLVRPGILRSLSNLATLVVHLTYYNDLSFLALLRAPDINMLAVKHLIVTLANMSAQTRQEVVAAFSRHDFLPDLVSLTLFIPSAVPSSTIRPFVEGLGQRVADTVVPRSVPFRRLVVESQISPNAISIDDARELGALQQRLQEMT
ncbi:hypothetical protein MIND_01328200 [Mycena indigotica]|uniref:Uncharacterized protein n=1 Tax=Mycena indigotica TaxID=2126181 RepID=A0A8H6RYL7_9AGAR|nr:uncharacterized protein MIND_01328200 [Mycena indigotica]KAF7290150.1 hypothetical protein MIND_01328200 [Mycena indigotica]